MLLARQFDKLVTSITTISITSRFGIQVIYMTCIEIAKAIHLYSGKVSLQEELRFVNTNEGGAKKLAPSTTFLLVKIRHSIFIPKFWFLYFKKKQMSWFLTIWIEIL